MKVPLGLAIGLVLIGSVNAARAAEIQVQAAVSSKRPYLGDPVRLQISVEQPVDGLPQVDSAKLEAIGFKPLGEPSRGHSRTIINGVRSEKFTYDFYYQFTPSHTGRVTIPAVEVRRGDATARTSPIELDVIGPEPQDVVVVELNVSDRTPFPGEQVTITVSLFVRRLTLRGELLEADPFSGRDPPRLRIPWLEGTEVLKPAPSLGRGPQFSGGTLEQRSREDGPGFLLNDLFVRSRISFFEPLESQLPVRFDRGAVERPGPDGAMQPYYRYTLPLEYRAARAGLIGPLTVQVRGSVFRDVRRGPRGLEAEGREVFAVSDPLSIQVPALPKAGQPATFSGGVGSFKATASARPTRVRVGDPIELTVRVTGRGNLEEMAAPPLDADDKWASDFKVHEDASPGRLENDTKTFTFTVRPKSSDVRELPAVRISYFNPRTRRYEDTYTDRLPLEVVETARLDSSEIVGATTDAGARELQSSAVGLEANYVAAELLEPHGPYRLSRGGWAAVWFGPPLLWCAAFGANRWVVARRQSPARIRAESALRRATEQLDGLASVAAIEHCGAIARAVGTYLADRLDQQAAELTPAEARACAERLGAGPDTASRLEALLERCDRHRFAPAVQAPGAPGDGELAAEAREILVEIDRTVARPRRVPAGSAARFWLLAFLMAAHAAGTAWGDTAAERQEMLERAQAAFEQGARSADAAAARESFREAVSGYRALVDSGIENGKLYYNLANSYFRIGDIPRAILFYRCAERLLPRDPNIVANLAYARSRVADRVSPPESGRLQRHLIFAHYDWSVRERTRLAIASFVAAWTFWIVRIWYRRTWLVAGGLLLMALVAALGYSAHVSASRDAVEPIGVVTAPEVIVRKGDGETYEPEFNRAIGSGIEFRMRARRDDWIQIELLDGKTGWVRIEQVALAPGYEPSR